LSGAGDWIALNGINEWRGGAHLLTDRNWRWDAAQRVLVAAASN